jgi:hypothetical protein
VIASRADAIQFRRIGLAGVASIADLRSRIVRAIPELGAGAVALVDSPRWPRDLDLASGRARRPSPRGRAIDAALRAITGRISMFPTPALDYFAACVRDPRCKPHLRALADEMFAGLMRNARSSGRVAGGRIFTRFMIAGFAAYRALETLGIVPFESYPDLAYRLWKPPCDELPPKSERAPALKARRRIIARVARLAGIDAQAPRTLDEADAAILAVGAAAARRTGRGLLVLENRAEGSFLIPGGILCGRRRAQARASA